MGAALTIRAVGCEGDPSTARVEAVAIGLVNGERRTLSLKVASLPEKGVFAIAQQWPNEGHWVIRLVGHEGRLATTTLVSANQKGVNPDTATYQAGEAPAGDVEAMLRNN